jgi:phenylacetate-CoA ligase
VRLDRNLMGEYKLIVERAAHLDRLTVGAERVHGYNGSDEELAHELSRRLQAATGVRAAISILPPDALPRATHKAKRVEDRRTGVWG